MRAALLEGTSCGSAGGSKTINTSKENTVKEGKVGVQEVGNLFQLRRLGQPAKLAVLNVNDNLSDSVTCAAGTTMLQVDDPVGYQRVHETDPTLPLSFDMQEFKKRILVPKHRMGREYGQLARNLGHVGKLDQTVRSWVHDGSVSAKAAEKWLALLGGTDHDRAEEVLTSYIQDSALPSSLREAALGNLLTQRKRMHSTIEMLWELAHEDGHEHQEFAHMVCGALLKRYSSLEDTKFMPARILELYRAMEEKVKTALDHDRLATALGALGNTRWAQSVPHLLSHLEHPKKRIRQTAAVALRQMKVNVPVHSYNKTHTQQHAEPVLDLETELGEAQASKAGFLQGPTFDSEEVDDASEGGTEVGGDDCAGLFSGAIICFDHSKVLTESDHHKVEFKMGIGLGVTGCEEAGQLRQGTGSGVNFEDEDCDEAMEMAIKGGGGFDVALGVDGDDVRMLGLEASIEKDKNTKNPSAQTRVELVCTVTVLGFAVPANFCNFEGTSEELTAEETTDLQVRGNDPFATQGLTKYEFDPDSSSDAGLQVKKIFWEMTFISVAIRFVIWIIPVSVQLAVSGETNGKLGIKIDPSNHWEMKGGLQPGAEAVLTIEVAIDIFIARFGVGGEITIVEAKIPAVASWLPTNPRNAPNGAPLCIALDATLELLAGRVYAFVEIGFWIFCCLRWEFTILEWDALITVTWPIIPGKCLGGHYPTKTPMVTRAPVVSRAPTKAPMVSFGSTNRASGTNNWDHAYKFDCPANQAITKMTSSHSNHFEDRKWHFTCNAIVNQGGSATLSNDRWGGFNGWDGTQNQACGTNEVMTGIWSDHSNGKEDRRYRIKCSRINGATIKSLPQWSQWANGWDGNLDYTCQQGLAMTAMYSQHSNGKEDRRFKFKCGQAQ